MDGNGRWAKKKGLPRTMGHKRGAEVFESIVRECQNIGIPVLTVYAFSTENWKRPQAEVSAIMGLLRQYLDRSFKHKEENIRLIFIGDRTALPADMVQLMHELEQGSAQNDGITLNIAINYGGRDELICVVKKLAGQVKEGKIALEDIDEQLLSDNLYTATQPDPDLIIRPSGEQRLSNFLTWQSAYSEFVFMDVLWPDFNKEHLYDALWQYAARNRRFGGL